MNNVVFPDKVTATLGTYVGVALLMASIAYGVPKWPLGGATQTGPENLSTFSAITYPLGEITSDDRSEFISRISTIFAALSQKQNALGIDFEKIWDANIEMLYES